jgi:bacteriocin-like protein
MREIKTMRELTIAELNSVTGGQGASAAGAGLFASGAAAGAGTVMLQLIDYAGNAISVSTNTAAAIAYGN